MGLLSQFFYYIARYRCRPAKVRAAIDEICTMLPSRGGYNRTSLRVGAASVAISECRSVSQYVALVYRYVREAALNGAKVVCLPEYIGLLALPIMPFFNGRQAQIAKEIAAGNDRGYALLAEVLQGMSVAVRSAWLVTCSELARRCRIYIVAGSALIYEGGKLVNRATMFDDRGRLVGYQDKLHLSDVEERLDVVPGRDVTVLETIFGKVAFPVGSDSRYFEPYRIARSKGAELFFCPSASTQEETFYQELRGFECRMQEVGCFGVKSVLYGEESGFVFNGRPAIYGPLEMTKYRDGIVAIHAAKTVSVTMASLDMERVDKLLKADTGTSDAFGADQLRAAYEAFLGRVVEPQKRRGGPGDGADPMQEPDFGGELDDEAEQELDATPEEGALPPELAALGEQEEQREAEAPGAGEGPTGQE